jgi:hypothetical protein
LKSLVFGLSLLHQIGFVDGLFRQEWRRLQRLAHAVIPRRNSWKLERLLSSYRLNSEVCEGIHIALHLLVKDTQQRQIVFPKRAAKSMYGDPFVSLAVAVLFAIIFYRRSSIPNGL